MTVAARVQHDCVPRDGMLCANGKNARVQFAITGVPVAVPVSSSHEAYPGAMAEHILPQHMLALAVSTTLPLSMPVCV